MKIYYIQDSPISYSALMSVRVAVMGEPPIPYLINMGMGEKTTKKAQYRK